MSGDAEMLKGMLNDCRRECERLTRERDAALAKIGRSAERASEAQRIEAVNRKVCNEALARAEEAERRNDELRDLSLSTAARAEKAERSLAAARDVLREASFGTGRFAQAHSLHNGNRWIEYRAIVDALAAALGGDRG